MVRLRQLAGTSTSAIAGGPIHILCSAFANSSQVADAAADRIPLLTGAVAGAADSEDDATMEEAHRIMHEVLQIHQRASVINQGGSVGFEVG